MTPLDESADKVSVAYAVLGIERVNAGALAALAIVDVEIAGVAIQLQGVQLRIVSGHVEVKAPQFRDGRGVWRSAVILPPALQRALGDELLAAYTSASAVTTNDRSDSTRKDQNS